MEEKKKKKAPKTPKAPRQSWEPHWILKVLKALWMICFTAIKVAAGAVATVLCLCIICAMVFAGILGDYLQQDIIPDAGVDLSDYEMELNSYIYYGDTGDIRLLQPIYTTTEREWVSYDQIPEDLVHATIAIEDKRFYEHQGVDWITTVKACAGIFFGGDLAGGSTITQQTVKNATGEDSITVQRKVLEIFRALQLERDYDKEFILEYYLNKIYLGQDCYGVKTAAAAYFGKELEDLTIAECASLISITNNPSLFDPYGGEFEYDGEMTTGKDRNRIRQKLVLGEMLSQGWITQEEYDEAIAQEMVFKYGIADEDKNFYCDNDECDFYGKYTEFLLEGESYYCPVCGTETVIDFGASEEVYSWMVDTILEDVAMALAEKDGVEWNEEEVREDYMMRIQRGGYHIFSTINMDVQNQVDAIYENLDEIPDARSKQQLQSAIVIIDNATGDIVAMAGGVGEKTDFDAFNRATESELQTGSSIKPLAVYAPAFELGVISPATVISDMPLNYDDGAWPLNDSRRYNYSMTVLQGIVSSVNAVAVNTLDIIGPEYSFDFAKNKFGLSTLLESYVREDGYEMTDVNYAALGLGAQTFGCTVRDMATAFATFPNNGVYRQSRTFTKVYDSEGNLVLDNTQNSSRIISEKTATYINYCLNTAANRGTGYAFNFDGVEVAGKTGTTADDFDRWFCGYTPYYTAAVWTGYDIPEEINLVGDYTNPAGRLWRKVMEPIHEGLEDRDLYSTSEFSYISVCLDSGDRATDACALDVRAIDGDSRVDGAYAMWEDRPESSCSKHVLVDYCMTGGGVATEYCSKFADAKIEKRALVKMTQDEIDELKKASRYNLKDIYLQDNYIYLITSSGADAVFHGIDGDLKQEDAPYMLCPVHTKEAWEKQNQTAAPTDPTTAAKPAG